MRTTKLQSRLLEQGDIVHAIGVWSRARRIHAHRVDVKEGPALAADGEAIEFIFKTIDIPPLFSSVAFTFITTDNR